jgi:ribose/xylose/arabinose/galactoside ABC-type transport system permease subunit
MGFALCLCNTKAKLAIKRKINNHGKVSLLMKKKLKKRKVSSPVKKAYKNTYVKNAGGIIALALLHRCGWFGVMLLMVGVFNDYVTHVLTGGSLIYSVWTFVGYKCKWKHIFCSYQDAYHCKMTPGAIDWDWIEKKDAYGVPLIFLVMALMGIAVIIFL